MLKYRQGDVALEVISELPEGVFFEAKNTAILAEGEVTGHYHFMTCTTPVGGKTDSTKYPLMVAEKDGTMFLRITEPTPLQHNEHSTITVEPGTYKVTRQREYSPEAPRQVAD